jgi:hypothetical protein
MGPGMVSHDDFDLDVRVVAPDAPQPAQLGNATERCTARYGYYTCSYCNSLGCQTIMFCCSQT